MLFMKLKVFVPIRLLVGRSNRECIELRRRYILLIRIIRVDIRFRFEDLFTFKFKLFFRKIGLTISHVIILLIY